jgi:Domain of unknown function (DUF222)
VAVEAEPVLLEAARRLDPARLRQAVGHPHQVLDPDATAAQAERRQGQRGLWLTATLDGMVAVDGLLEPEAGQTLLSALEPLARPHSASDERSGGQRRADALAELARRSLEGGRLAQAGRVRPQLTVTVELDRLQGRHRLGGEVGWAGPLAPEGCRRLACDGAVTRVLVTRHPDGPGAARDDPGGPAQPPSSRPRPGGCPRSWVGPRASPGGGADHPGRPARPAPRPGRARRRLRLPRLRPPLGLV